MFKFNILEVLAIWKKITELKNKTVLVTGCAGFIGARLVSKLMSSNLEMKIVGVDNINDYYEISLKEYRLEGLEDCAKSSKGKFLFFKADIADRPFIQKLFAEWYKEYCKIQ